MNKSWCYYFHGITFIWLFSLYAALHLKLSMISDFIWLCKCKSFINSVLLPQMFPVEFHDIEYEVVYWRWTELRDLGVGVTVNTWNAMTSTFPCCRGSAVSSHSVWKLLFPTEEAGCKTFPPSLLCRQNPGTDGWRTQCPKIRDREIQVPPNRKKSVHSTKWGRPDSL